MVSLLGPDGATIRWGRYESSVDTRYHALRAHRETAAARSSNGPLHGFCYDCVQFHIFAGLRRKPQIE